MPSAQPRQPDLELEDFLLYLREQGFPCGVGERVRAYRLYAQFLPRVDRRRLKQILGPVFARSDTDQRRFSQAYDLFFALQPADKPGFADPIPDLPLPTMLSGAAASRADDTSGRRRRVWVFVAFAAALVLVASLAVRHAVPQTGRTVVVEQRPGPVSEYREVRDERDVPIARPCRSMECLASGSRPWLLSLPVAVSLIAWAWVRSPRRRRWNMRRREQRRRPPYSWPVCQSAPTLAVFQGVLTRTADAMRRRLAGNIDELDVPRTIDSTIAAAGFPRLRFRRRDRPPEYLFFIDQRSEDDHLARWWRDTAAALQRLGVAITVYTYSGDLRRCYSTWSAREIRTPDLLDMSESHHVVVFGRGRDLLQRYREFPAWMDASFLKREHAALLTAAASFEWGAAEQKVRTRLPVLPGRVRNLVSVGAPVIDIQRFIQDENREPPSIPSEYFEETEQSAGGEPPSLAMFLDTDVFQWLCACAVYPALEWHLTLRLGLLVDPAGTIFEERKLLQLIRLPWFRAGQMPGHWRSWLVKQLSPEMADAVRRLIVDELEHNPAPRGSFARDQQVLQVAAQRYWLDQRVTRRLSHLLGAMEALPAIDVEADFLLSELKSSWKSVPVRERARMVWARYVGSRWRVPASGAASAALVLAALFAVPVADTQRETVTRWERIPSVADPPKPEPPVPAPAALVQLVMGSNVANPDLERLPKITRALQSAGIQVVANTVTDASANALAMSEIRFFDPTDSARARDIEKALGAVGLSSVTKNRRIATPSARFELWLATLNQQTTDVIARTRPVNQPTIEVSIQPDREPPRAPENGATGGGDRPAEPGPTGKPDTPPAPPVVDGPPGGSPAAPTNVLESTPRVPILPPSDRELIKQVLGEYARAMSSKDIDAVRAVYPSVNVRNLRPLFENTTAYSEEVSIGDGDVTIQPDGTVTVQAKQKITSTTVGNRRSEQSDNAVFTMAKRQQRWIIQGVGITPVK